LQTPPNLPQSSTERSALDAMLNAIDGRAPQDLSAIAVPLGFISVVGQEMGDEMNQMYMKALAVSHLDRGQVAAALVDLKRRIQGDFFIVEQDDAGADAAVGRDYFRGTNAT
jgi:hypothetical protein